MDVCGGLSSEIRTKKYLQLKYTENTALETLLYLLRIAVGSDAGVSLPVAVDWKPVMELSIKNGVSAIAFDGLQKLRIEMPKEIRYEWFVHMLRCEQRYGMQVGAARSLAGLWKNNALAAFILKGFSYAQYYPVPGHRASGDIDCFVKYAGKGSAAPCTAWELADKLVSHNGVVVDNSESKHSRYVVGGVSVENHRNLIGVNGSRKRKTFDAYLQSLLNLGGGVALQEADVLSPCWLFNALFYVAHARVHFLEEDGISLRHVLDWVLIRKSKEAAESFHQFERDINRFGLSKFFRALDGVADYVIGAKTVLSRAEELLLDDVLAPKEARHYDSKFMARLNILRMVWENRWKYKYYSETSAPATMWRYIYGHFFDRVK